MQNEISKVDVEPVETTRYRDLPLPVRVIFLILTASGLGLAVLFIFQISIIGNVLEAFSYYFLLIAVFSSGAFLILPARKKDKRIPWYDLLAAAVTFGVSFYFFVNAWYISNALWGFPSGLNFALALTLMLLLLECGRRMGGWIYFGLCALVGFYPLFAPYMPGVLEGFGLPFDATVGSLIFSVRGLMGPMIKVFGDLLVGFLIFAGVLIASGAGRFFLNIALSLLGTFRGGAAKVSVFSSALFGSLSGSALPNIVATGSVTIPTMKRIGYPPEYAGAVEAVASTGGIFMPPVMGSVAFVMAEILGIQYAVIIVAAIIPAILYYFCLLMQVDSYAARVGLKGLPRAEIPSVKKTLAEGWHFIFVFAFLLVALLYMRVEEKAPFYAVAVMLLLSFFSRETMITPRRFVEMLTRVGTLITQAVAILLPMSFIIGGLLVTGVGQSFTASIVFLAGENLWLVLLFGIIVCYVMGMAGLILPAYIFLAISLAPAVVQIGQLNVMAVHLFIIYYAMLAVFTWPVAAGAYVAATIAGANGTRTSFQAMRLGVGIYFIPFFFVFSPSLILRGSIVETGYLFIFCLIGITLIAGGMQGYLLKIGNLQLWARPFLVIAGFLIAFPEWWTTIAGAVLTVVVITIMLIVKRKGHATSVTGIGGSSFITL